MSNDRKITKIEVMNKLKNQIRLVMQRISRVGIHGELLKLGFAVAQSTVAKYMARKSDPSGQSWGTFLRNHAPQIAAMDLFVE
jgi:hypothetical protein